MDEAWDTGALWRLTVEHSPIGMALVDVDGSVMSANRALCAMLLHSEAELRTRSFHDITHPDDAPADVDLFEQALAGELDSYRITKRYVRSDGLVVWGDLSVALVRAEDGAPLHFISQVVDISAQRVDRDTLVLATDSLERERRISRAILDTVDVGLVLIDESGRYERQNRRHADFLALAFPDGHHGRAGQLGAVYAADGRTPIEAADMPSVRASQGEEFDDSRIWVGEDPLTRRALSVSARTVRSGAGYQGSALAYSDVTDLMRAVRAREEFVATVSHELRTPLASVLNHLELLRDTDAELGPEESERSLEVINRNAQRLHRLVADLLASARQRNGGLTLETSDGDLLVVVREAVEAAQPGARKGGVELVVDAPSHLWARVDHGCIRQVVDNLLSNAVKYTERGGRVELLVRSSAEQLVLSVSDTGVGIDDDDLERVFEPFFRAPTARRSTVPGLGLGLSIVRTIVEGHDGDVEVSRRSAGGVRVDVRLPTGLPVEPTGPAAPSELAAG